MAISCCPHCRADIPSGAQFCIQCGRRITGWLKEPHGPAGPLADSKAITNHLRLSVPSDTPQPAENAHEAVQHDAAPLTVRARPHAADPGAPPTVKRNIDLTDDELRAGDPLSLSEEMALVRGRPGRTLFLAVLVLVVAAGAATAGYHVYRKLRPQPLIRPAVIIDLDAEPVPVPPLFADDDDGKTLARLRVRPRQPSAPSPVAQTDHGATNDSNANNANKLENIPVPVDDEIQEERQAAIYAQGIKYVVHYHRAQITSCYESTSKTSPSTGRVDIGFIIDAQGRAQKVATLTNSTRNPALARCLEELIGAWQFPRPRESEFSTSYPFVFTAG